MKNFYELLAATTERFPSRPAVEVQHRDRLEAFTYAELRRLAEQAAGCLEKHGVASGDRVALLAENDAYWCAAYLGALCLGGVAVPLDTNYKAQQVSALLRDSDAQVIWTSPRFLPVAEEAVTVSGVRCTVLLLRGPGEGRVSLEALGKGSEAPALAPCPAGPQDRAVILYTSGTTSDPKGVVLTHSNLMAEAEAALKVIPLKEQHCVLGVLPLFHALAQMANLLAPFAVGARVVFLESLNTTELLRALQERQVTHFACVPQFFYLIHQRIMQQVAERGWLARKLFRALLRLNAGLRRTVGRNLGPVFFRPVHHILGRQMQFLITGGSRFDTGIGEDFYALGFTLLQAYGLTETSGGATATRPDEPWTGTVGRPLPGVEVKILPSEPVPGEEATDGEVAIRGPIVMEGYYNRPEATAEVLRDGWLHTGDLGRLDEAGRLLITGRRKEIIVLSSGKNIYPEEIEAHYLQTPFIKEICVMGLARPGEPAAERLHAVVVPDFEVLRERKIVNAREIVRFELEGLSIHLPGPKRVLSFEVWSEELPRTTTRKLRRFEIEKRARERAATPETAEAAPEDRPLSAEEAAWQADPQVGQALEVIREAAKQKKLIRADDNLDLDLGFDSMERVELMTRLEQVFGTDVPDETASRIYSVRELIEAVRQPVGSGGRVAAGGDSWSRLLDPSVAPDPEVAALLAPRSPFALVLFALMKALYAFCWLFFRFRVEGREHLPASGPFLLSPNHQTYIDPLFLVSALPYRLFREVYFVGASEFFETPLMRWIAGLACLVPVDPDRNLVRAMQAGAYGLRQGRVLVLFPEGERTPDGEVKRFKKGAAILSLHLRVPIVPAAFAGLYEVWP
ncbi:MAG: AMP-binding protein, partial [Candidatus Acidiferrales bacterium]